MHVSGIRCFSKSRPWAALCLLACCESATLSHAEESPKAGPVQETLKAADLPENAPIPELKIIDSKGQPRVLQNVTVRKVEPDGLSLMHDSGTLKVPFESLPAPLREKYNYDPVKAREFAATDAKRRDAQELAAEREGAAALEKEEAKKRKDSANQQIEDRKAKSEMEKRSNAQARNRAAMVQQAELEEAETARASALRAMQRAIRTRDRTDEARAMKMLQASAPDSVKGFTDYLAAKAAAIKQSEIDSLRLRVQQLENAR